MYKTYLYAIQICIGIYFRAKPWTTSKGSRLIILDAVTGDGFVPNALLTFQSKSTKDYHEEMDGPRFQKW